MDKPVNAKNISPSLVAEGASSRPSMQRIQEGLLVAQWGADGSGKLGSNSLKIFLGVWVLGSSMAILNVPVFSLYLISKFK